MRTECLYTLAWRNGWTHSGTYNGTERHRAQSADGAIIGTFATLKAARQAIARHENRTNR